MSIDFCDPPAVTRSTKPGSQIKPNGSNAIKTGKATEPTRTRSGLALFYEGRLVGEITQWQIDGQIVRFTDDLGLLPGMVVELATDPQGTRTSGIVGEQDDGGFIIRLEALLV